MRNISSSALSIVGLLLAALHGPSVQAEVRVQGPASDVRLEASDATVAEILAALGARFELRVRGAPASRRVTATFEGPLHRVLARVLDGFNFVIETRGAAIEVIVFGTGSPSAVPPAVPATVVHRRED